MKRGILITLIFLILFCMGFAGAGAEIRTLADLKSSTVKIGVSQGSAAEAAVQKEVPNAVLQYYTDNFMGYMAVAQGKLDAYVYDLAQMERAIQGGQRGVRLLPETLQTTVKIIVGISPVSAVPDLPEKVNRFIRELREAGTLDEMYQRWLIESAPKMPEIKLPENPEVRIIVGTTGTVPPYSYYEGQGLTGYDIELAYRFAAWLGADLTFSIYDFGSIIEAAGAGKIDLIMSNLQYLPERSESSSIIFSDTLYEEKMGVMVRDTTVADGKATTQEKETSSEADPRSEYTGLDQQAVLKTGAASAEKTGFWADILSSFQKTFLREDRWRLFGEGILNTLYITLLSILCGTALGFGVFMLCRNGNPIAGGVTRFSIWLVQGTPMVVLLMILYYIVFGKVAIKGILVAVIGFSLTFGAAVFGLLKMGVGAVDHGQYEAAYALGYTSRRTFFKIILPQALPHVIAAYQGEIVGLIKATSIVGYIAVQDLTKMGDIVRSRTYEAFFPLIAITVIYFLLEGLLSFLVSRISININPKRRKSPSILKGVQFHD